MKKRRFSKALASVIIALSLLNTGCWDRFELTELGFVEALAIDEGENGSLRLTTQFLKPTKRRRQPSRKPSVTSHLNWAERQNGIICKCFWLVSK